MVVLLGPAAPAGSVDRDAPEEPERWIRLPVSWNGLDTDEGRAGGFGHATYRLKVLLDEPNEDLAVRLPFIRTAYKLWVNGKLKAQVGQVGDSEGTSSPQYFPQIVYLKHTGDTLDIVLQVSNYDHRLGGPWQTLELGEASRLTSYLQRKAGVEMALAGGLLAMGMHHIGLFLCGARREGRFYWVCLFVCRHPYVIRRTRPGVSIFPELSWQWAMRIEYLCFYLGMPSAVLFSYTLYPQEMSRRWVQALARTGFLFAVLLFLLPMYWMTRLTVLFQLITIIAGAYVIFSIFRAIRRGRTERCSRSSAPWLTSWL